MAYRQTSYSPSRAATGGIPADAGQTSWRNFGKWGVALLFFGTLSALLVSLQLFQVTAASSAKPTLRRAVAALSEIDPLLDRNYDDLRQRAAAIGPGDTVELRDFPVSVPLTKGEVLNSSKQQLRELLLGRAADAMYARGSGVLHAQNGDGQNPGMFSAAGLTGSGLDVLRNRHHEIFGVLTFVLAGVCAALATTLAALCRGFGRLASLGAVVLAASAPMLLGGIGAWLYTRTMSGSGSEYVRREFLQIGQELAWIPIRDGIAFTVLGAVFLAVGTCCAIWADGRSATAYRTAH